LNAFADKRHRRICSAEDSTYQWGRHWIKEMKFPVLCWFCLTQRSIILETNNSNCTVRIFSLKPHY
jgi:hypothetical protein